MKSRTIAAVLAGMLSIATGCPAAADDAPAILAKIGRAQAAQPSFVMTTTLAPMGLSIVATFVHTRPAAGGNPLSAFATHLVANGGSFKAETYIVDSVMYISSGGMWQKRPLSDAELRSQLHAMLADLNEHPPIATVQPDRVDAGKTYGDLRLVIPTPESMPAGSSLPSSLTLECMYDKASFLMHECDGDQFAIAYGRYGDPANVVVLPAAAANATPLTLPMPGDSPAPASSPAR